MDLRGRRHVLHVAPVDEGDLARALADRGADAVHRGEAAADDHDAGPLVARVGQAERGRAQVLQAVDDAVGVLVRDAQLVGVVAADRDDDAVEALVLEVVEREVLPQLHAAAHPAAEARDGLVLGLEDLHLRQAVLRDAVAEHAAGGGIPLEDRHVVAGQEQVERGAHARRAGADDGGAAAGRGLLLERQGRVEALVEHRPQDLVAGVAVAVADRDRLVHLVAPAVLLARGGADAAEDAGERDRALEDPHGLPPVGLRVRPQEARDVDVARALVLAGRQAVGVVVREDQLEVRPADPAQLVGLGADHHVGLGGAGARDRWLVLALDLDHAHPAGPEARQLGLVAQGGDLDAVVAADLEDRLALEALDDAAVDLDPDARRALGALRRLRGDQALGERVVAGRGRVEDPRRVGTDLPRPVERTLVRAGGARDQVGHQRDPAAVAPAPTAIGVQTPAGQVERRRWSSSSGRK